MASGVAGMLFAPIAGRISDRVGHLRVALAAGVGLLIVTLIYAFPLPSWAMLGLLVAIGPLFTTLATTIFPLAASGADEEGLGHGAAYALLGIGWSLGFVIGPPTAGAIADAVGDSWGYAFSALVATGLLALAAHAGQRSGALGRRVPDRA